MNKHQLCALGDELEAEHGPYPEGRDNLEIWLMGTLTILSDAGIHDAVEQRAWLHKHYPAKVQELEWLNLTDVGFEVIDCSDRKPPDSLGDIQAEALAMNGPEELAHQCLVLDQLVELANRLESDHGAFLGHRDDLLTWIAEELNHFHASGLSPIETRAQLHEHYQVLVERDQPPPQERETLDISDPEAGRIPFAPPKARIGLKIPSFDIPDDFDTMGSDEIQWLFEGGNNVKKGD